MFPYLFPNQKAHFKNIHASKCLSQFTRFCIEIINASVGSPEPMAYPEV
jgi:hypothetical protein